MRRSGIISTRVFPQRRHRTPDQIFGPYFPIEYTPASQVDLTSAKGIEGLAQEEIILLAGCSISMASQFAGVPVVIRQANTFGRYVHVNDPNPRHAVYR